jgi:hypothetical protein
MTVVSFVRTFHVLDLEFISALPSPAGLLGSVVPSSFLPTLRGFSHKFASDLSASVKVENRTIQTA